MSEPRLTEQAEADLDELWAYIAAGNPAAADRMVDAVLEGSRMHVRFPSMGQNREDLWPGLRSFIVSPFVVWLKGPGSSGWLRGGDGHVARQFRAW